MLITLTKLIMMRVLTKLFNIDHKYKKELLSALTISLGSFVVGFTAAYSSPAVESMKNENVTAFKVSEEEASWVGGLMPLASLLGSICGGPLIECFGRKRTLIMTAIPFIIAWLMIAYAYRVNIGLILAGRALDGLCVGIASLSFPVYLGEILQPEVRGTLGLLPTAFGNIAILLCYAAGSKLNWSSLAFLGAALPAPFLVLMFFIPETPRWSISHGREESARSALIWLRGKKVNIETEYNKILNAHFDAIKNAAPYQILEIFKKNNLKPVLISMGLMFFQQFSGINAVIFYSLKIFKDAGSTIDVNLCSIIIGVVNFSATFIAAMVIDRLGRKILLYISGIAMTVSLLVLGSFFYCKNARIGISTMGWVPLASLVIYILGFSLGYGPIPWLMMGEILPGRIRGPAASVVTSFNWICTFIITKSFTNFIEIMDSSGTFWFFGGWCFLATFFVFFYVPETQGKSLEEIEQKILGKNCNLSPKIDRTPFSIRFSTNI